MNIILLSGGSGKRLWPLSNGVRAKQFVKIFKKPSDIIPAGTERSDDYESMLQRVYRQIKTVEPNAAITIATSKAQISAVHNQLGTDVRVTVEPCRRDTFPAIALATAYLHEVMNVPENEAVVVCPVDPYADGGYFYCIKSMYQAAEKTDGLVLMGIIPTYPSEKYGYIHAVVNDEGKYSFEFKEKPDLETAQKYLEKGCLWNGGVFAFKLSYVLRKSKYLLGTSSYKELLSNYKDFPSISFDYAVAEHETDLTIVQHLGKWKDLGTWNTLTEAMEEAVIGNARMNDNCENVHIINELNIPILAMGLKNMVVSASPDGILVSDLKQSSYIKPYVDAIKQQVMFAEKSWGNYCVLDVNDTSLTIKVTLNPGHKMNYHSHQKRDEVWTIVSGSGKAIIDGKEQLVKPGDVITIGVGSKHTVIAGATGLLLIEVQLGNDISVDDKEKFEMPE